MSDDLQSLPLPAIDPMPVITATRVRRLRSHQIRKALATNRDARSDIPAWAGGNDGELLDPGEDHGGYVFDIGKVDQE